MNILFMMPTWEAASEVWIQRMMEYLSSDLKAVVVNDTQGNRYWRGGVRAYSLNSRERELQYFSRIFKSFGFSLKKSGSLSKNILRDVINQSSISHIICHYGTFAVKHMQVWQEISLPLFVHFHGYDATFDLKSQSNPGVMGHSIDYLQKIIQLSTRAIFVVNSEYTKKNLIKNGVDSDRILVKYLGVPIPKEKKIHEKNDELIILQLGRLVDCKSPDRTINAFEIARLKGLKAKLIIAGDGPLRTTCELLRLRSKYKDSIIILGEVKPTEAEQLMANADIYTQHNIKGEISNQEEALGVSILEAMAAGLPIVGTKSGGVVETVLDGKTGLLLEPGDVEGQAYALVKLGSDVFLRRKMGEYGRERISKYFSTEKERNRLLQILRTNNFSD